MTYTVSLTSQGQISIPVKLQKKLGLTKPGKVTLNEENGKIIIKPIKDLLELKGTFKTNKKIPFRKIREGFEQYLADEAVKGM